MKHSALFAALAFLFTGAGSAAEITYDGTLYANGEPANGMHTLRFTPFATASALVPLAKPVVLHAVDIPDGAVKSSLDFGASLSADRPVWLQVEVAGAGGDFHVLGERQIAQPKGASACWSTEGNAGLDPATQFIGTVDESPLAMRVGGHPVASFEMPANQGPNGINILIGRELVTEPEIFATTVVGGYQHHVRGDYSTIIGGRENKTGSPAVTPFNATIIGGLNNLALGTSSAIAGGAQNLTVGTASLAAGGDARAVGDYSVAHGKNTCAGGEGSTAMGTNAKVRPSVENAQHCSLVSHSGDGNGDEGSFVWADQQLGDFATTGPNQFLIRARGGVGVNTAATWVLRPDGPDPTEVAIRGLENGPANLWLVSGEPPAAGVSGVAYQFKVTGSSINTSRLEIRSNYNNLSGNSIAEFDGTGRLRLSVDNPIKPTAGGWSAPSDSRLKTSIASMPSGVLDRLLSLHGVNFEYRLDAPAGYFTPGTHAGFIAQEVEKIFPDWVSTDEAGYRLVGPKGFEALVVEALRELRTEKDRELAALKAAHRDEVAALTARLDAMALAIAEIKSTEAAGNVARADER